MMKKRLRWLLLALVGYPLGCGAFLVTQTASDSISGRSSKLLLAEIHSGMVPTEVEALVGRPSEYTTHYASYLNKENYSHNWTVRGHRLEVNFIHGRAAAWHTFPPNPGPVSRFFGRVFFWWLEPFFED